VIGHAAHPDGDGPADRQRIDAGLAHVVVSAVEVDQRLRPEAPLQRDLLLDEASAVAYALFVMILLV
jgi:hypothetical protein